MSINGIVLFSSAVLTTLTLTSVAGLPGASNGGMPGSGTFDFPGLPAALLNAGTLNGRGTAALFQEIMKVLQASKYAPPSCTLSKALASACQMGEKTTEVCSGMCKTGECCLHKPGQSKPTCQPLILSGQPCSWRHCTMGSQPNDNQAIYGDRCPCNSMCCLPVSSSTSGGGPFQGMCNGSFK